MTIQIYPGKGLKNWRVRLVSGNGKTLATSEGYFSKWNATRAAKRMFPQTPIKYVKA
jgi:uncharacterized protein YegP (UPF0339 family)